MIWVILMRDKTGYFTVLGVIMSIVKERYYRGVNLGGWLSQCAEMTTKHFDAFIVEEDFEVIKASGFDHVRVPFDYDLLEDDETPFEYSSEGLEYLKKCLNWGKKHGLNVILDLHKAPGYSFDTKDDNQLFTDIKLQDRTVALWAYLAKTFKDVGESLVFELLNEIVEPDSSRWNLLATRLIETIADIDPNRYIIVGGNSYNATHELKNLALPDYDNLIYTFHFYEPFFVTHQKAYWSQSAVDYDTNLSYPAPYVGMKAFLDKHPEYHYFSHLKNEDADFEAMKRYLEPAVTFYREKQVPLYCGEFGVIALADMRTRENWHRDFMTLLDNHEFGGAVWSYKKMDFELFKDRAPVSQVLVDIVAGKEA